MSEAMMRNRSRSVIAIARADAYPETAPFHPSEAYPEYRMDLGQEKNTAYAAVRELFFRLGLDAEHYGSADWNPLGTVTEKGQTVVIKPNFVRESNTGAGNLWSVITHPSVIRAVVDYVYIALKGEGRIIIADTPTPYADFEKLLAVTELEAVRDYYRKTRNFTLEIYDLREFKYVYAGEDRVLTRVHLRGDPEGYTDFELENQSYLKDITAKKKILRLGL